MTLDFSVMYHRQREYQAMIGDAASDLTPQERVRRIGHLQLLAAGQATHMMQELGYETHKEPREPNWLNALHEWVDQFKYLLAEAVVAGFTPEQISQVFHDKTDALNQRWMAQNTPRPELTAVFDMDGVIARWDRPLTMAEMAFGALRSAVPIPETVQLMGWLRGMGVRVVIVTARKIHVARSIELDTEWWLAEHKVPFDQLVFAYDKYEAVKNHNVMFAVEDSHKHAMDYAESGITTFFVRSKDPDSRVPVHENVTVPEKGLLWLRIREFVVDSLGDTCAF